MAGVLLIFLGFVLILIAISIAVIGSGARGVGIVVIGPIPIILSGGTDAMIIMLAVMVAILIALIAAIFLPLLRGRVEKQL